MDDILTFPNKYRRNLYDQRKAYLSAESIQRSISELYDDGEKQSDIRNYVSQKRERKISQRRNDKIIIQKIMGNAR